MDTPREQAPAVIEEIGLKDAELAVTLGINPLTVWKWRTSRAKPDYDNWLALIRLRDERRARIGAA